MSVKKIILSVAGVIIVGGFLIAATVSAVNNRDKLEFQKVELKSKDTEIKELNLQYDNVNDKYDKALQEKNTNQAEIDRLKAEKEAADKERERLKAELQAKAESKAKLASVSTNKQVPANSGNLQDIIVAAANKNGVDVNRALKIASCESTYNANSVNYNYWEDSNGTAKGNVGEKYYPSGLFQHITKYWPARAAKHGYAGASIFDPVANANVTMAMWREGHASLWECK